MVILPRAGCERPAKLYCMIMVSPQTMGTWMTKVEALLRRLLLLRARHPEEKSLVFSTFPPALDLVRAILLHGSCCTQKCARFEPLVLCHAYTTACTSRAASVNA